MSNLDTSKAEAMQGVSVITWEDVPLLEYGHLSALGHPRRRAAAREGRGALPRPADRGRGGARARRPRWRPSTAITADFDEQPALFDVRKAFDADAPADPRRGQLVHALRERDGPPPDPQGQHRGGVRPGRPDRPGRLPPGCDRARADRDAGLPGRARRRTGGSRSTPARRRSTSRWASSRRTCSCR